jgi:AGZA family xanthine/uracil permease-like MFS transporter
VDLPKAIMWQFFGAYLALAILLGLLSLQKTAGRPEGGS